MDDRTRLRVARPDDIPQVLLFWRSAAENRDRLQDKPHAVLRLLERDPEALTLAEVGDEIVGTLVNGWDGWRFHLYRLAVSPSHRGQGIARLLLGEAERRCAQLGADRVDAMVLGENTSGRAFWEAVGYAEQADWRRWVRPVRQLRSPPMVLEAERFGE